MLPHEVLGVGPDSTPTQVRAAFRRLARRHHPDRGGDPERFRAGVEAYRRLTGQARTCGVTHRVVFYRRPRGLAVVGAAVRARLHRRRRAPRVI